MLPLGTGNDLARVLGWGSSCDDDTHLPQLLEKYEKATTKMLDRWSIMTFERTFAIPKLSLTPNDPPDLLHDQISQYEKSVQSHIQNVVQSDETSVVLNSAKHLCDIIKDLATQVTESTLAGRDEQLNLKCDILQQKLDLLLQTLTNEEFEVINFENFETDICPKKETCSEDTDSRTSCERRKVEKVEKDLNNFKCRSRRRSRMVEREVLLLRANSLKKAMRCLVQHTEQAVDERNQQVQSVNIPTIKISISGDFSDNAQGCDYKPIHELRVYLSIYSYIL